MIKPNKQFEGHERDRSAGIRLHCTAPTNPKVACGNDRLAASEDPRGLQHHPYAALEHTTSANERTNEHFELPLATAAKVVTFFYSKVN